MKRAFVILGLAFIGFVFCLGFVFPVALIGSEVGFGNREVFSERSGDGTLQVSVMKRVAFPGLRWVDPAIVVTLQLRDVSTGKTMDSVRLSLLEDSDFNTPVVHWQNGGAQVTDFDSRLKQTVSLKNVPIKRMQ